MLLGTLQNFVVRRIIKTGVLKRFANCVIRIVRQGPTAKISSRNPLSCVVGCSGIAKSSPGFFKQFALNPKVSFVKPNTFDIEFEKNICRSKVQTTLAMNTHLEFHERVTEQVAENTKAMNNLTAEMRKQSVQSSELHEIKRQYYLKKLQKLEEQISRASK